MICWRALKAERIDAVISVVGGRGLSILYKLHRKGLNIVGIPRSIENDVAATAVSFGFNSALSFTIEMLDRAREAAQSARKIAVVEVLGAQAGWIALQAGIAAGADAVLIPEIPCDLQTVAERLKEKMTPSRQYGLVVVAEGVQFLDSRKPRRTSQPPLPSKHRYRRSQRVKPVSMSSSDRARPPRPWPAGCNC